jgi:hypothetical protein
MASILTRFPLMETAGARLMVSACAGYSAALWRGDDAASAFAEWLAGFWEPSLTRPPGPPDARSIISGDRDIDWFERDGWVSGHVAGVSGGYLVPRAAIDYHPWLGYVPYAA